MLHTDKLQDYRLALGWIEQGDLLRNEGIPLKDGTHVDLKKCQWDC
ncbi:MGMT family protein [Mobilisporobacter senegalensis]